MQNNNVDEKDDVFTLTSKKKQMEYYNKSDFLGAKCLYDIIFQNIDLKDQIYMKYLNVPRQLKSLLDSLMQSKKFFAIAAQASDNDDPKRRDS